jgi:hypothetical protein
MRADDEFGNILARFRLHLRFHWGSLRASSRPAMNAQVLGLSWPARDKLETMAFACLRSVFWFLSACLFSSLAEPALVIGGGHGQQRQARLNRL